MEANGEKGEGEEGEMILLTLTIPLNLCLFQVSRNPGPPSPHFHFLTFISFSFVLSCRELFILIYSSFLYIVPPPFSLIPPSPLSTSLQSCWGEGGMRKASIYNGGKGGKVLELTLSHSQWVQTKQIINP